MLIVFLYCTALFFSVDSVQIRQLDVKGDVEKKNRGRKQKSKATVRAAV